MANKLKNKISPAKKAALKKAALKAKKNAQLFPSFFVKFKYQFNRKKELKFLSLSKSQNIVVKKGTILTITSKGTMARFLATLIVPKFRAVDIVFDINGDGSELIKINGLRYDRFLTIDAVNLTDFLKSVEGKKICKQLE